MRTENIPKQAILYRVIKRPVIALLRMHMPSMLEHSNVNYVEQALFQSSCCIIMPVCSTGTISQAACRTVILSQSQSPHRTSHALACCCTLSVSSAPGASVPHRLSHPLAAWGPPQCHSSAASFPLQCMTRRHQCTMWACRTWQAPWIAHHIPRGSSHNTGYHPTG